jgi:hypothetical protein
MVTRENLVFSISAARRLLGVAQGVSIQIREFFKVVWVWVKGKRPTFVSKRAFKQHFVDRRRAAARALTATQWIDQPKYFTVRNESKNSIYQLEAFPDRIECDCEDYRNQIEFLGRGCCKHGYAVLNTLGFRSLGHYIEAYKPDGYLRTLCYTRKAA